MKLDSELLVTNALLYDVIAVYNNCISAAWFSRRRQIPKTTTAEQRLYWQGSQNANRFRAANLRTIIFRARFDLRRQKAKSRKILFASAPLREKPGKAEVQR